MLDLVENMFSHDAAQLLLLGEMTISGTNDSDHKFKNSDPRVHRYKESDPVYRLLNSDKTGVRN